MKKSDKKEVKGSGLVGLGYELCVVVIGILSLIIPLIFLSIMFWFISVPIIIIITLIIIYLIIRRHKQKKRRGY
jgi:hypothetical protein